ncbi:MAG: hypothetical protein U0175_33455 [Caldilineaceae bacterium]
MRRVQYWLLGLFVIAVLFQGGCAGAATSSTSSSEKPAITEKDEASEFNKVILTEKAAQRINLQTDKIREEQVEGKKRTITPYASLIYGLNGETWIYTTSSPLTFMRAPVKVDFIEGDNVVLAEGPAAGTEVAVVGVPELYGIDTGVGK